MEIIYSLTNEKIKRIKKLKDKIARCEQGMFVVEGANILKDLPKHFALENIVVLDKKLDIYQNILNQIHDTKIIVVDEKIMDAISDTKSPCGILAIIKKPVAKKIVGDIVVLDGLADPGNFGTIARTCVACGVKSIIAIDCVDWTSSKVVRASMGGVLRLNIIECDRQNALDLLKDYEILTLDMGGKNIFDYNKSNRQPIALVVGGESSGISKELAKASSISLSLPMVGDIESLNAGVALSISLYQLKFAKNK